MWFAWMVGALSGCWEPDVTGPKGMVGRVLASDGSAVSGMLVESMEAETRTSADGRFAVQYKAPDQLVHWVWRESWYQRTYSKVDDGKVVELRLPQVRDVSLHCEVTERCAFTLRWSLGVDFSARRSGVCDSGGVVPLAAVPDVAPSVECNGIPAQLTVEAGEWTVRR